MTTKKFASKKFAKKPLVDIERYRGADESISRTDAGKLLAKLMRAPYDRVRQRMHRAIHGGELPTTDAMRRRLNIGELGAWGTQTWPEYGAAIAAVLQPSYTVRVDAKAPPGLGKIHFAILPESLEAAAVQIDDLQRQLAAARAEIERLRPFEEKQKAASKRKSEALRGKPRRQWYR
jgi:hypothetical protein